MDLVMNLVSRNEGERKRRNSWFREAIVEDSPSTGMQKEVQKQNI
jgi:hypothetical protein